jgi:hypothetical protein
MEEFDEPRSTITYGIPLKNNNKYLTLASENASTLSLTVIQQSGFRMGPYGK